MALLREVASLSSMLCTQPISCAFKGKLYIWVLFKAETTFSWWGTALQFSTSYVSHVDSPSQAHRRATLRMMYQVEQYAMRNVW